MNFNGLFTDLFFFYLNLDVFLPLEQLDHKTGAVIVSCAEISKNVS